MTIINDLVEELNKATDLGCQRQSVRKRQGAVEVHVLLLRDVTCLNLTCLPAIP